jgi:hypothetical protein
MHRFIPRELRRPAVGGVLVAILIAFPLGAMASHQFSDVPNSNPFHADISAIAGAGVTTGCGGGNFCPKDAVTREQMAAFMNRLGALSGNKPPVVNADRLDGLDADQFARSDVLVGGHANCNGGEMIAANNVTEYTIAGQSTFFCPLSFPNGATVTGLRARVRDVTATGEAYCYVKRHGLLSQEAVVVMGTTTSSGLTATPGQIVIADLVVVSQTIDNSLYEYIGECRFSGPGLGNTGLYAYSASYTVEGPAVP